MKALNKHQKKIFMWYKVKELSLKGLNKSQIAYEVGLHRKTVRKYLNMEEHEFHQWIQQKRNQPRKLSEYYDYVYNLLDRYSYFSASQVEDRLKEEFSELPMVHSKTVYNFTEYIRNQHNIKKKKEKPPRQYEKLPEPDYGMYAQVDFGEYYMQTKSEGRKKVYFFAMVLCRSRQKYVYIQATPFTSSDAIKAHDKAFNYYQGQPKKIIYDQDRVFVVDENLGDILLTSEFKIYCQEMNFEQIFCRKSDPESKGKVENVVKFVKQNFLRGRIYEGEDLLNKSVQGWLKRTGNGKEHAGIKKIPQEEWKKEQPFLLPLPKGFTIIEDAAFTKYKVRKDNTINYKSNFYSLPLGTYTNADTWVLLKEKQDEVCIYDINQTLLTIHSLCYGRGESVRNIDHLRDKSQSISNLKETILGLFKEKQKAALFIEMLQKDKPRYVRDNLLFLKKHLGQYNENGIDQSLDFCLENHIYNSSRFIEIAAHFEKEQQEKSMAANINIPETKQDEKVLRDDFIPQKSEISIYEEIL